MGDLPLALATHERALAVWEKALGPGHPRIASSLGNTGSVLADLGEYERAKGLQERALTIWEPALGPDHPKVAMTLNNLNHRSRFSNNITPPLDLPPFG